MRKLKLAILGLFVSTSFVMGPRALAFMGDEVNNGGGLGEKNIILAYQKLGRYLDSCINSNACNIKDSEKNLLQKIAQDLPREYENKKQLVFKSGKKNPEIFTIDGEIKVAVTGNNVGSNGCPVTSSSKLPTQFISSLGEYTFFELNGEEFCYFIQLVDSKGNPIGSVPINFISGGLDSDKRVEYSSTDLEVVNNGGFFVAHHKSEKYICFIPGGQTNTGGFIQFEFMGNDEYLPSKSIMYQLWQ